MLSIKFLYAALPNRNIPLDILICNAFINEKFERFLRFGCYNKYEKLQMEMIA